MLIYFDFIYILSFVSPPIHRLPDVVADVAQNMFQMSRVRHGVKHENLQRIQQITILRGVSTQTPAEQISLAYIVKYTYPLRMWR